MCIWYDRMCVWYDDLYNIMKVTPSAKSIWDNAHHILTYFVCIGQNYFYVAYFNSNCRRTWSKQSPYAFSGGSKGPAIMIPKALPINYYWFYLSIITNTDTPDVCRERSACEQLPEVHFCCDAKVFKCQVFFFWL